MGGTTYRETFMPGMNHEELHDLVRLGEFTDRLLYIAEATADDGLERGFVATRSPNGDIVLSDVLDPDEDYADAMHEYEERLSRLGVSTDLASLLLLPHDEAARLLAGNEEAINALPRAQGLLEFLRLLQGGQEVVAERPELALEALLQDDTGAPSTNVEGTWHTHPTLHVGSRSPRRFLLPSPTDLRTHADNVAQNPGIIEATVATHHKLGGTAMLLWRPASSDAIQRLQAIDPGLREVTDEFMKRIGLLTANLVYNRRDGSLRSGIRSLRNLYQEDVS